MYQSSILKIEKSYTYASEQVTCVITNNRYDDEEEMIDIKSERT